MSLLCPRENCFRCSPRPKVVRFGSFYRSSDRRTIRRFRCLHCRRTFSQATGLPCFGQKKRQINERLRQLLCSSVSQRRAARLLKVHRITVARKMRFLAEQACQAHLQALATYRNLEGFQFDELETFEHSKWKPLSVALAVLPGSRKILGFEVALMPARGKEAPKARKKYGRRPDHRRFALNRLFQRLAPLTTQTPTLQSDDNPRYPPAVRRWFAQATHQTTPGRRGCVVGQGELKRGGWDPLFSLNHTFAMARANLSRLVRQTWCTTKTVQGLADHLAIYVHYHNSVLT